MNKIQTCFYCLNYEKFYTHPDGKYGRCKIWQPQIYREKSGWCEDFEGKPKTGES